VNLRGQHIGGLFTFLAGLIILAHTVVPHHHHFELSHSSEQESTCESPDQEKNSENPDSHCHAFNVLIIEKTSNLVLNQSCSDLFKYSLIGIKSDIKISPFRNVITTFVDQQAVFLEEFFFSTHLLRGPPSNA